MKNKKYSLLARKIFQRLDPRRKIFFDDNDINNTVYIAGSARSGTTWLQNIVNFDGSYRVMFEPFRIEENNLISHFKQRQYIRIDNKEDSFISPVRSILSGQIKNDWIDNYNHKLFVSKRLIKDVRSTLFLKWLKINFQTIPIIYILRHPCSVALSRIERGFKTHLDVYLAQEELVVDFLSPFLELIHGTNELFDKHILMWCIDNYVPLKQFNLGEIHILYYENLCTHPELELEKLFKYLGKSIDTGSKQLQRILKKPSLLSREGSAILDDANSAENWKKFVTKKQEQSTMKILHEFGMGHIYSDDTMPQLSENEVLL